MQQEIGIIGHGVIAETALLALAKELGKEVVIVDHFPKQVTPVKIEPFKLVEVPRPFVDDRPLISKHRKGHSRPKISATQQRKARQRKNKTKAKSRRKNKKP